MTLEQDVAQPQELEAADDGNALSGEETGADIFVQPKALDGEDAAAGGADSKVGGGVYSLDAPLEKTPEALTTMQEGAATQVNPEAAQSQEVADSAPDWGCAVAGEEEAPNLLGFQHSQSSSTDMEVFAVS